MFILERIVTMEARRYEHALIQREKEEEKENMLSYKERRRLGDEENSWIRKRCLPMSTAISAVFKNWTVHS